MHSSLLVTAAIADPEMCGCVQLNTKLRRAVELAKKSVVDLQSQIDDLRRENAQLKSQAA
jgi:hypothetical protein